MRNLNLYMIATLIAAGLAILSMPNNLPAREWSEPIRLTNHEGEWMISDFDVKIDSRGNIHLLYRLDQANQERLNLQTVYLKCNSNGDILIEPFFVFPDEEHHDYSTFTLDHDDNPHILVDNRSSFIYTVLDENGEYSFGPRYLDEMDSPWYGGSMSPCEGCKDNIQITSDGNFVMECPDIWTDPDDEHREEFITYTRFTPDGEVIDSTFIVHREIRQGQFYYGPNIFKVDANDNLYFALRHITGEGNFPVFNKVAANDSIMIVNYRPPPMNQGACYYSIRDMIADEDENLYMVIAEMEGESSIVHIRKLNPEFETVFDVIMGNFDPWIPQTRIDMWNDTLGIFRYSGYGPDGETFSFISIDLDGNIIDSLQFFVRRLSVGDMEAAFHGGECYVLFNHAIEVHQYDIWMIKGSPLSINDDSYRYGIILPSDVDVFPNPFNEQTGIDFDLPRAGDVRLSVYDLTGREVRVLADEYRCAGRYRCLWTNRLSGIYFVVLQTGMEKQVSKVVCLP